MRPSASISFAVCWHWASVRLTTTTSAPCPARPTAAPGAGDDRHLGVEIEESFRHAGVSLLSERVQFSVAGGADDEDRVLPTPRP